MQILECPSSPGLAGARLAACSHVKRLENAAGTDATCCADVFWTYLLPRAYLPRTETRRRRSSPRSARQVPKGTRSIACPVRDMRCTRAGTCKTYQVCTDRTYKARSHLARYVISTFAEIGRGSAPAHRFEVYPSPQVLLAPPKQAWGVWHLNGTSGISGDR